MSKVDGLVHAHRILAAYADELSQRRLKWWQIGRCRYHQVKALAEFSDRLHSAVTRALNEEG